MNVDFHLHSNFSGDCDTPLDTQIRAAIDAHIELLCITEHLDQDYPHDCIDFSLDIPAYLDAYRKMKEKYQDQIQLLFGIELGLQPHLGEFCQQLCKTYPFDFVLGSTHVSSGIDPYFESYWKDRSTQSAMERFFADTLTHIRSIDCFDSLGHLDYPIRYILNKNEPYSCFDYMDLIDECLKLLIHRGQALEVNTGGYKAGLGAPHPVPDILKRYKELGGELLTIGSDAHFPQYVGYCFDQAIAIIKDCGFRYLTIYEKRIGRQIPL